MLNWCRWVSPNKAVLNLSQCVENEKPAAHAVNIKQKFPSQIFSLILKKVQSFFHHSSWREWNRSWALVTHLVKIKVQQSTNHLIIDELTFQQILAFTYFVTRTICCFFCCTFFGTGSFFFAQRVNTDSRLFVALWAFLSSLYIRLKQ